MTDSSQPPPAGAPEPDPNFVRRLKENAVAVVSITRPGFLALPDRTLQSYRIS
jgi:hypothetical protein